VSERVLVTGALGCVGAWAVKAVLADGDEPVGYDLGEADHRLRLVLSEEERARLTLVRGDITDLSALGSALDEHEITRVVHLAALQVPFCRADPVLGARVNVVGTVNVFEAVKARLDRIPGVAYASSAAVYGPADPSPAPESGGLAPATLYGVYKLANEGTARLYWTESAVPSVGIRPYVVYGPGRDQGMTSGPTLAMEAAARGERFEITYGGAAQYDYAPDVGRAFVRAANCSEGAVVGNFPGVRAEMSEVVSAIEAAAPASAGRITWDEGTSLPFPPQLESGALEQALGPLPRALLAVGVAETVARFGEPDSENPTRRRS
jgi:nucleoside-diphosphate-sugar epimerase